MCRQAGASLLLLPSGSCFWKWKPAQVLWKLLLTVARAEGCCDNPAPHLGVLLPSAFRGSIPVWEWGAQRIRPHLQPEKTAPPFTRQIIGHGKSTENIFASVLHRTELWAGLGPKPPRCHYWGVTLQQLLIPLPTNGHCKILSETSLGCHELHGQEGDTHTQMLRFGGLHCTEWSKPPLQHIPGRFKAPTTAKAFREFSIVHYFSPSCTALLWAMPTAEAGK